MSLKRLDSDRQIHAITAAGNEIVRYDRAGKWWIEYADGARFPLTLAEAVEHCLTFGATVFLGASGGKRFDAMYRSRKGQA